MFQNVILTEHVNKINMPMSNISMRNTTLLKQWVCYHDYKTRTKIACEVFNSCLSSIITLVSFLNHNQFNKWILQWQVNVESNIEKYLMTETMQLEKSKSRFLYDVVSRRMCNLLSCLYASQKVMILKSDNHIQQLSTDFTS